MADRITTLDEGYVTGQLSVYPQAIDTPDQLYLVANNAETVLKQSLTYLGKTAVVEDAGRFPASGILRIGPAAGKTGHQEFVYYSSRTQNTFTGLQRAFAGSRRDQWPAGSHVISPVAAENHNAKKDALINIETNLGTKNLPLSTSLNGILTDLETRFLSPKSQFRAFPLKGAPPLAVRFQNFSAGQPVRFLWDFGDGLTSQETNPVHIYQNEGIYTVQLSIITTTGGQGISTKKNYIEVSKEDKPPFFYVNPPAGVSTASSPPGTAFEFVDQTDGDIVNRFWVFDDGTSQAVNDPNKHTILHTYAQPGVYQPSLLAVFTTQKIQRVFLSNNIIVT